MIRKITPSDRDTFLRFTRDFYRSDAVAHEIPQEYHVRTFEELMRSDVYTQGYFLCDGETPVGYALTAKTFSQEAGGIVIWIEEIYLTPESRGKGLGKEFFRFVFSQGAARLRLEAEEGNTRAIALYRSLGFRQLEYIPFVYESDDH